ncbi:ATP-grasp fold amidoligase family protein [Cetobacterium somerae]
MIGLSKKLTEEFEFVRVDFYECNGNLYFGELAFTPDEWDYKLGEMREIR